MWTRTALVGLCLGLVGAAAACDAATAPSPGSSTPTDRPVLSLTDVDAEPVELREETVKVAFDAAAAAEFVTAVPADLDFAERALVCVFLGPRLTTGWSLDLRSASLTGRELRILARETAPRGEAQEETTYPADCALLPRAALPTGELHVRADDTATDEFIADTVIDVPPA
jgi:hypothetical protein